MMYFISSSSKKNSLSKAHVLQRTSKEHNQMQQTPG